MDSDRGLIIDGAWRRTGGAGENPAMEPATGEAIGATPMASAGDTPEVVAASRAFSTWSVTAPWTRAGLLHRVADVSIARTEAVALP